MEAMVCNMGPGQIQKRRNTGVVAAVLALAFLAIALILHWPVFFRLPAFLFFWIAGLGFFQAQQKTCVAFAAKNIINMDEGEKPVRDAEFLKKIHNKAKGIHKSALIFALILTLLAVLIPV